MRKTSLLLPLLLGCSLLRQAGSSMFERPTLSFKEARLPHVDFRGAELDLVFLVTNPNSVGLDLTSASYDLEVEGHKVASGSPKKDRKSTRLNSSHDQISYAVFCLKKKKKKKYTITYDLVAKVQCHAE